MAGGTNSAIIQPQLGCSGAKISVSENLNLFYFPLIARSLLQLKWNLNLENFFFVTFTSSVSAVKGSWSLLDFEYRASTVSCLGSPSHFFSFDVISRCISSTFEKGTLQEVKPQQTGLSTHTLYLLHV